MVFLMERVVPPRAICDELLVDRCVLDTIDENGDPVQVEDRIELTKAQRAIG